MEIHTIDLTIVVLFVLLLIFIAVTTNKVTRSVAGFLSSERCAGRYLLTLASAMAYISAASFVGGFQSYYENGLGGYWWMLMGIPLSVIIAMSGWVTYRFRATRALTMPQFLEMRYSRNFRIFSGFLAFFAGVLNCGIFPAVTSRFIMAFLGMPDTFTLAGFEMQTFPVLLFFMVLAPLTLAIAGGQISIMVTDFFQGTITNIACLSIVFFLLFKFDLTTIFSTLQTAPEGHSLIHPFKQGELPDFGPLYFVLMMIAFVFQRGVWQGNSGYNSSAKSPHESRMAFMLGEWRNCINWSFMIVPIIIWVVMHNPNYSDMAAKITEGTSQFGTVFEKKETIVPVGLRLILPPGLIGLMLIMMIGAAVSTDDSCYHSWGSIFLQDAIMPFRKKPFTQKEHLLYLRLSIVLIGVFAFVISLLLPMKEYLAMWTFITSAIFVGGAGCAVIGGLYWKRGTTQAAWTSMIAGSVLSAAGIILRQIWEETPILNNWIPFEDLPNGLAVACSIYVITATLYIIISLLTCKKSHNMDKLLHRGKYAVKDDHSDIEKATHDVSWFAKKLGLTKEFSKMDKFLYTAQYAWVGLWVAVFFIGTAVNMLKDVPESAWIVWWKIHIGIFITMATIITIWFGIGGTFNIIDLYRILKTKKIDENDDGMVIHDNNEEETI